MMHWGNYGWGMGSGLIFVVLFLALIIFSAVYDMYVSLRRLRGEPRSWESEELHSIFSKSGMLRVRLQKKNSCI
jgi:hypothetical protein